MNKEKMSKALAIQNELIKSEHGFIKNTESTRTLFLDYYDAEVSGLVDYLSEAYDGSKVFRSQDAIYLIPGANSFMAIKESEINIYFYVSKDKDVTRDSRVRLPLFYYISLNLFGMFYGGTPIKLLQDYTTTEELIKFIDASVERALTHFDEKSEEDVGFSILKACDAWSRFVYAKEVGSSLNSKVGFTEKVISFLKKHGLVAVIDDAESRIYPERKLTDLISNGVLDADRIRELKILSRTEIKGGHDADNQ